MNLDDIIKANTLNKISCFRSKNTRSVSSIINLDDIIEANISNKLLDNKFHIKHSKFKKN